MNKAERAHLVKDIDAILNSVHEGKPCCDGFRTLRHVLSILASLHSGETPPRAALKRIRKLAGEVFGHDQAEIQRKAKEENDKWCPECDGERVKSPAGGMVCVTGCQK